MIKISTFLLTVLLFFMLQIQAFSQTNGSFNYQAVIRKSTGTLVQKTAISVKFSIVDKTEGLVFSETQNVTTDAYGVINLIIGNGTNQTGSLGNINWENNQKLKVEVDYDKDGWMDLTGISEITQVPKSFYSSKAGLATKAEGLTYELSPVAVSGDYKDLINTPAEQTLSLDDNYQLNISKGNSVDLSILKDGNPKLSLLENILSIEGGNSVSIPLTTGDMEKAVYDTDGNNKMDIAETTEKIQGISVSTATPLSGQVLQYDGSDWVPGVVAATDEKVKVGTGDAQVLSTTDFDGTSDIVIKSGAITSIKIADESVTDAKIASGISASKVGLENVDNTSDANKPISTATQAALNLKANSADLGTAAMMNVGTGENNIIQLDANSKLPAVDGSQLINLPTGPVSSVAGRVGAVTLDKSDVGLVNVDNTSDANKPISTATQAALNLKATLVSPALTGTPTAPTASAGNATTQVATTAFVSNAISSTGKATASNGLTATNGNVTLGGALTTATIINQGANDVNFTGTGKVTVDNIKVTGAVYVSHIRTHALPTNVVWQAD
ncbi:MAG TPA: hypothetical protein VFG54_12485, partial [Prolixibacteraceae bacterium]|nr:hypothetical protein [Prolixibacteraceae bacterium]